MKMMMAMPWLQPNYIYDPLSTASKDIDKMYEGTVGCSTASESFPSEAVVRLVPSKQVSVPKHILLTAPSNAAVDEVISRLMHPETGGIVLADGKRWFPKVVRLGPNPRASVREWGLEALVQAEPRIGPEDIKAVKSRIIHRADIVATTLSCCGMGLLADLQHGFDTVIIDEAAQAVEVSTLIPLRYNCVRCILLGDEQQLPATVFSKLASTLNYQRSFFERLVQTGLKPKMLMTQYRMHPAIALFASTEFYESQLENAASTTDRERRELGSGYEALPIAPLRFFNVNGQEQMDPQTNSTYNESEVDACLHIFTALVRLSGDEDLGSKVGIITLYNEQVGRLRDKFKKAGHRSVDISTVDGFQGREKEIIFVSCVRGINQSKTIGFLKDLRRINVAITRARDALYIVGCAKTLSNPQLPGTEMWRKMVHMHKELGSYIELGVPQDRKKRKATDSNLFIELQLTELGWTNDEQMRFEEEQERMLKEAEEKAAAKAEADEPEEDEGDSDDYNDEGIGELVGQAGSQMRAEINDEVEAIDEEG